MVRRIAQFALAGFAVALVGIQLVPYRAHNPPIRLEPAWDSPETRALAKRACFDCHSNEVEVPWYGYVAPFAWPVRHHVDEGRAALNLSEMDRPQEEAHDAAEALREGEMPPRYYLALFFLTGPAATEKRQLADGLVAVLGDDD